MNSLLQALFMTPQVRQLVYSYVAETEGQKPSALEYNIPYQLQQLFARLEVSVDDKPVNTKALTKSFHWTSAESFQ